MSRVGDVEPSCAFNATWRVRAVFPPGSPAGRQGIGSAWSPACTIFPRMNTIFSLQRRKKISPLRGLEGITLDFRNVVAAFSLSTYSSRCLMSAVIPRPAVPFSQPPQGWQSWWNCTRREQKQWLREGSRSLSMCLVAGFSWETPSPWRVTLSSKTAPFLSLAHLIPTVPAITSFTGYWRRIAGPAPVSNHFLSASFAAWRLSSPCDTPAPLFLLHRFFASHFASLPVCPLLSEHCQGEVDEH